MIEGVASRARFKMSLYDGLFGVETAPVPELILSSALAQEEEEEQEPSSPKRKDTPESVEGESSEGKKEDEVKPTETAAQETKSSLWSASNMKLMASQMMRQQMVASRIRGRGGSRGRGRRPLPHPTQGSSAVQQTSDLTRLVEDDLAGEIQDEYDPLLPNNFEEIMRIEKEKTELLRLKEKEKRREHYQLYATAAYNSDSDEEEQERKRKKLEKKQKETTAIPPPTFNAAPPPAQPIKTDQEEEGQQEGRIRSALEELSKIKAPRANPYGKKKNFKTSEVASNIMTKYGWQEGQGLGKASQGISTALAVEKTSFKGGKIVNVAAEREQLVEEEKKKVKSLTSIIKNPTKVILLENMVGPGEVDNDLQPEVIEECTKYGEVKNCLVYEIPEGASDDEAVRIFVEFAKMDSAIKAVIDLNGRYFGGRMVRAGFYSEEKFARFDLAPS